MMIGSTLTLFGLLPVGAGHGDEPAAPVLGHDGVHRLVVQPLLLRARHRAAQEAVALPSAAAAGRGTPARVVPDHGGRSGRGHLVLVRGLLLVVLGGESGQNRVTVVGVLLLLLLLGKVVVLVVGRASSSGQVAEAHVHIGKQRSAFKIKRQIRCMSITSIILAYYGFCSSLTNLKPSCQSAAL